MTKTNKNPKTPQSSWLTHPLCLLERHYQSPRQLTLTLNQFLTNDDVFLRARATDALNQQHTHDRIATRTSVIKSDWWQASDGVWFTKRAYIMIRNATDTSKGGNDHHPTTKSHGHRHHHPGLEQTTLRHNHGLNHTSSCKLHLHTQTVACGKHHGDDKCWD